MVGKETTIRSPRTIIGIDNSDDSSAEEFKALEIRTDLNTEGPTIELSSHAVAHTLAYDSVISLTPAGIRLKAKYSEGGMTGIDVAEDAVSLTYYNEPFVCFAENGVNIFDTTNSICSGNLTVLANNLKLNYGARRLDIGDMPTPEVADIGIGHNIARNWSSSAQRYECYSTGFFEIETRKSFTSNQPNQRVSSGLTFPKLCAGIITISSEMFKPGSASNPSIHVIGNALFVKCGDTYKSTAISIGPSSAITLNFVNDVLLITFPKQVSSEIYHIVAWYTEEQVTTRS